MKKRHGAEQIVGMLRQADVALGKGENVPEVFKQLGISEQTYYRWRTKSCCHRSTVANFARDAGSREAIMTPSRFQYQAL